MIEPEGKALESAKTLQKLSIIHHPHQYGEKNTPIVEEKASTETEATQIRQDGGDTGGETSEESGDGNTPDGWERFYNTVSIIWWLSQTQDSTRPSVLRSPSDAGVLDVREARRWRSLAFSRRAQTWFCALDGSSALPKEEPVSRSLSCFRARQDESFDVRKGMIDSGPLVSCARMSRSSFTLFMMLRTAGCALAPSREKPG